MAGYAFRAQINSNTIQKRDPVCQPMWIPSGPCEGDGHSAFQNFTQTNCPNLPRNTRFDCSSQMPFTCSIDNVQLDSSVKTCGDCTSVPEGESCFLVCADGAATFTEQSMKSILCLQSGFVSIEGYRAPRCVVDPPTCPPIISWNGVSTDFLSKCIGAFQGEICRISCMPGYYSENGWYDATCTSDYTWSRALTCECQACGEFGDPACATSSNNNGLDYKYI